MLWILESAPFSLSHMSSNGLNMTAESRTISGCESSLQ